MPKRNFEKGLQGALSLGAYGALEGHKLRKRYGKKGVGAGALIGATVGGLTGYLSGVPDPKMGEGIYEEAAQQIRAQTLNNAQKAAAQVSKNTAQAFANRKLNLSPLAAGVDAANQGRVHQQALESLIPLEADIAMRGAQDKLMAQRAGEYETRQGWQDTAFATALAGKQMLKGIMDDFDAEEAKKKADYEKSQAKLLPTEFGGWTPEEQAGYLMQKGLQIPDNWSQMSATDRMSYVTRVFGMSMMGPANPVYSKWPKEGQFKAFDPGAYSADADAIFNAEQYGLPHPADPNWEQQKDAAEKRMSEYPVQTSMPSQVSAGMPIKPTPGFDGTVESPVIPEHQNQRKPVITPPVNVRPAPVDTPESAPVATERPIVKRAGARHPVIVVEGERPQGRQSTTPPEGYMSIGTSIGTPEIVVEGERPQGRQSTTPPEGYMSIGTSIGTPGELSDAGTRLNTATEKEVASYVDGLMQSGLKTTDEILQRAMADGRDINAILKHLQQRGASQPQNDFEQQVRDLIDWGEGGFYAKPFDDPESGLNIGIGRSLTYNGMSVQNEIIPFLKDKNVSDAEIAQRLASVGITQNSSRVTLTEDQFNTLFPEGITPEQGQMLLENDIKMFTAQVEHIIGREVFQKVGDVRKQVLIDMMYTLGSGSFSTFKGMIDAIKEGDFERAADEMKWKDPNTKAEYTEWYKDVKPRRADPLILAMRTGWRAGKAKPRDMSKRTNTIPTALHDVMPQEVTDQIAKTAETPPTQAELTEFRETMPQSFEALLAPGSPFASAGVEPYTFQILQQTAAQMGDERFASIVKKISGIMTA